MKLAIAKRALCFALAFVLLAGGCRKKKQSVVEADFTRPQEKWLETESIRLLRDYVRIDTSIGKGEEEGARFLKEFFDCAGIEAEVVCPAPRRCNVLARLPGRRREGALLLLNHIDVAPADPKTWLADGPPFEGRIRRGYLYGRGTYDMKSLAIAQALAMRNLKEHGIVPESDVLFLGEADEEIGQTWGARWLLDHRPEWFSGVGQVLNEGGTVEVILRDPRFWGIETLQAGYATAEFEAPAAAPLKAFAESWRKLASHVVVPHPHVRESFDMLANHLSSPLTDPLRHLDRVRKDPAELALLPDRYAGFLEARIYWSTVLGSPEQSPTSFALLTVLSTPPGIPPERWLGPILADAAKRGVRTTRSFSGGATSASPYPTPFTDLLARVTATHFPGIPFGPVPNWGGFTTSDVFRRRGFPTYGYSSIPMNITDTVRRHTNNERIYLRDYLNGVDIYRDVLEEVALAP